MSLFQKAKLYSIEDPIAKNAMLKDSKRGEIPKDAAGLMVSINILEATFGDYFVMGHKNNAKAGWSLALNKGGSKEFDPRTGVGPSKMTDGNKALSMSMPLPQKWYDLYQTWNMAFCSQMPQFPYIIPKLFIPKVANYQDNHLS